MWATNFLPRLGACLWQFHSPRILQTTPLASFGISVLSTGRSTTILGRSIDRIEMNIESTESKKCIKIKTPLLKELSRSSRDSFESESNSKESQDDRLNSFKSGVFHFCHFLANWAERPGILSNWISILKNPGTIGLIRPKVAFWIF